MKTLQKMMVQSTAVAVVLIGASVFSSVQAQVNPTLSTAAQDACKASAVAKGFQVAEVVSVEPKTGTADGVDVVLSLTRDGQPFKLTCGYTAASGAAIGDTQAPAATTAPAPATTNTAPTTTAPAPATTTTETNPGLGQWWWLLPLLGLPLLFWLWRSSAARPVAEEASRHRTYVNRPEAIVRGEGRLVNIYSGAGTNYGVTGTLRDGQKVTLSGRSDNSWVELAEGGWVHRDQLEAITGSGYVNR